MIHTCYLFALFLLLFRCKRSKIGWKKFGHDFLKKIENKKKDFSDLPTLIIVDMSLETDIFFFLASQVDVCQLQRCMLELFISYHPTVLSVAEHHKAFHTSSNVIYLI